MTTLLKPAPHYLQQPRQTLTMITAGPGRQRGWLPSMVLPSSPLQTSRPPNRLPLLLPSSSNQTTTPCPTHPLTLSGRVSTGTARLGSAVFPLQIGTTTILGSLHQDGPEVP